MLLLGTRNNVDNVCTSTLHEAYPSHAVADQEEVARRDLQLIHPNGPETACSGSRLVPDCPSEASEPNFVRQAREDVRCGEHTSSCTSFETAAATIRECFIRGRGDSRGGTSDKDHLGEVPGAMGRVLARVGTMEDSRQGITGGPCRDVGAAQRREEHGGIPSVEARTTVASSALVRACPGCSSTLLFNEGASVYPLCCDGSQHVGPKSIKNSQRFSCISCGRYAHTLRNAIPRPFAYASLVATKLPTVLQV